MKEADLKKAMNELYTELINSNDKKTDKKIIAKAIQLGMNYQTQKIKEGINIVFSNL